MGGESGRGWCLAEEAAIVGSRSSVTWGDSGRRDVLASELSLAKGQRAGHWSTNTRLPSVEALLLGDAAAMACPESQVQSGG